MPLTAPKMRGFLYPSYMTARCPDFDPCELCTGCTKYNQHDIACTICESRKPPDWICHHDDEIQTTVKKMNTLFKKPMFHPDQKEGTVSTSTAFDSEYHEQLQQTAQSILAQSGGVKEK